MTLPEDVEKQLKQLAVTDREEAFRQLVEKYRRILAAYIYRLTGSFHETEDILQEVFVKAYNEQRLFQEDFKMRPWLYRVSANTTFSALRKIRKIFSKNKELFENTAFTEMKFDENDFEGILAKLKPEHRQVLVLRYYEGLEYKEISEVTGWKTGTVMSRLARAKEEAARIMGR